jgi:hypothetical protein
MCIHPSAVASRPIELVVGCNRVASWSRVVRRRPTHQSTRGHLPCPSYTTLGTRIRWPGTLPFTSGNKSFLFFLLLLQAGRRPEAGTCDTAAVLCVRAPCSSGTGADIKKKLCHKQSELRSDHVRLGLGACVPCASLRWTVSFGSLSGSSAPMAESIRVM